MLVYGYIVYTLPGQGWNDYQIEVSKISPLWWSYGELSSKLLALLDAILLHEDVGSY